MVVLVVLRCVNYSFKNGASALNIVFYSVNLFFPLRIENCFACVVLGYLSGFCA